MAYVWSQDSIDARKTVRKRPDNTTLATNQILMADSGISSPGVARAARVRRGRRPRSREPRRSFYRDGSGRDVHGLLTRLGRRGYHPRRTLPIHLREESMKRNPRLIRAVLASVVVVGAAG